jgi:ATP-dependent exoDNAse (exonuclease V) beta subunit
MSEHLRSSIILASAGTGKTFQLTSRYVGLLELGVDPSRILATTFTRQAAGQIFDRVVARLLESPGVLPLAAMLHALDRLGISTLDSLFGKLASAYAAELGLPPGWNIVEDDEDQRLRAHAVEVALEDGDRDDVLTLLRLMMAKRFSSAVASALLLKVKDAHGVFKSAPAAAWSVIDVPGDLHPLAEEELAAHLAAWFDVPLYRGKTGKKVDGGWEKAHDKAHVHATQGDWEAFAGAGLGAKILAGESTFYRGPIDEAVVRAYRPLLDHARWVLLTRHVEGTAALRDLLDRFDRAYATLKRKRRAYRFDDIPRALRAMHRDITLDEIAFRLDATIDHVLLDEFQDTSASQFALLEPLLTEILAGGGGSREDASSRSVFCVGDVKQSLYQWRDAEPGLFAALPGRWPQLEESELHVSHRSSPVILEVVNKVFGSIANNAVLAEHPGVVASWAKGFERHEATPRLKSAPGFARLGVAPRTDNGEPQFVLTLRAAAERVGEMVARFPDRSIGILVRAKKGIPRIIFELKRLGVDASEEGGNPLTDAPAVAAALSALHLGEHPGDTAAAFHVATSPLANLLGLHEWSNTPARWAAAARVRSRTIHGLAPLLSDWLEKLAPSCDARDVRRFEQLITLAEEFDARNDPRAENFVAMARSKHVDDPTAHRVRVLTIHTSKGLEFDAVVLPDLEAKIASKPPGMLYRRNDPFGDIDAVTRYPSEVLRALYPRLEALHAHHRSKALSEELCVLYVALTRARHSLDILIAPAKPNAKSIPFSLASILLEALAPGEAAEPGELFTRGDPSWAASLRSRTPPAPPAPIKISLARGESPARLGARRRPAMPPTASAATLGRPIAARCCTPGRNRSSGWTTRRCSGSNRDHRTSCAWPAPCNSTTRSTSPPSWPRSAP